MAEGSFVRIYHEDLKAHHAGVWDDNDQLATWIRLLAIADRLWPAPADVPVGVSKVALRRLVDEGLVLLLPHHRYEIRGLNSQRERQHQAAKTAADARWGNAPRNARRNATSNAAPPCVSMRKPDVDIEQDESPQPPASQGARINGSNARATGDSPRQVAAANERRIADQLKEITWRYRRGEISEDEERAQRAAVMAGNA